MKILAIEFSSPQRSVAVVQSNIANAPHARPSASEIVEVGGRSTNLLGMIEKALAQAQLDRHQIQVIAIGIGPGSYTGIRAAIAMAQGWQLATGAKVLGIGSADCVTAQAQAEGMSGRIEVVIDAQREEFYLAGYELAAAIRREIEPLRLATMTEVRARAQAGGALVGPEVEKWFPEGRLVFPRAATLGELALSRSDFIAGEKLEPIYLRETNFVKAPPPRILPD